MGKICSVAVAIVLLTAPWVGAGNFELLADSGAVRAPTPLHVKPGTPVKAEFRSNLTTSSDVEIDTENLLPEKVSAKAEPSVSPRPAVAFRERGPGAMAPPPSLAQRSKEKESPAESLDQSGDIEEDLEKDLVLSPPPPKTEELEKPAARPEAQPQTEKEKITPPRTVAKDQSKAAAPSVRKKGVREPRSYVVGQKPIQKVRPLTSSNPWQHPAGSHGDRQYNFNADRMTSQPCNAYGGAYCPMTPPYMTSAPQRRVPQPPTTQRFVREGVTVKLAPASAPGPYGHPFEQGQAEDDILSAVSEIIGLPFAFISSFF